MREICPRKELTNLRAMAIIVAVVSMLCSCASGGGTLPTGSGRIYLGADA
jgi:hypothetical protein